MRQVRLRLLGKGDLAAAHPLSLEAGWPHRLEDWRFFLSLGHGIAACDDVGMLVGTALWWPYGEHHATIGMVLVSRARRGQGIGRQLMDAALAAAGKRSLMLNSTEDGLRLYETLGFRTIGRVHQHQGEVKPAASGSLSAPAREVVLALDEAAFGAPRTELMAGLMQSGQVAGDAHGFAIRRRFGRGQIIGPIVARDEAGAIALVRPLLQSGFMRIDIPVDAARLAAFLDHAGMRKVDAVTVMARGEWPTPSAPPRRFGLVSQALG